MEFEFSETHNHRTNTQKIKTPKGFDTVSLLNGFVDYFHLLIDEIDSKLFERYEQGDSFMPLTVSNVIDVISKIEILKPND